ncbi:terminase ATPase subunit family protein [Silvimonas sp.]|uniref:terminase ATPase subunit family protein n=1 Tax=Silvimonas sp. TaxID=2650811 RepID=UPI00283B3975|nr:terminase ATPase subunit family protein [Silvimonas sp.]MDR3429670.1 terminase ATPase subunit family protein [Silvimonas sp.]
MNETTALIPEQDQRRHARNLYWQGFNLAQIADSLNVVRATLDSWKRRDHWDDAKPIDRVDNALEARMTQLIMKGDKDGRDFKEIDLLGRQLERIARVRKYESGGSEVDLNPKLANRNAGPKQKPAGSEFSEQQVKQLLDAFRDSLFGYQKVWFEVGERHRIRNILKSRQIGATWYFAREALIDAITTGRNQIFLSASKAQAHVFKQYIIQFAKDAADIELRGDPIILPNDATLYFLGTNARTAQSYHGNLYLDEYFWIHGFQNLRKVASGMAIHAKWRQTYFSTPSSLTHDAYPFWSGELFNKGRKKENRVEVDTTHRKLAKGFLCSDGQWRQIVTVEDAVAGGCDLFDLNQLRLEYSDDEYLNLLMCMFMDDTASVFPLAMLQRCMVDAWEDWSDFKPFATRPFGYREVWLGYDPSLTGDSAGLIVLAPPLVPGGKFRVLEKHQWRGMDFQAQADAIKGITERYRVGYIGIDATGIGQGVYQLVKQFFPAAEQISYSAEVKSRLVLKAYDVISKGRLEFDAGWTDLAQAFMAIRKAMTTSGRQVTYEAGRTDETGHADLAWAAMHALLHEPLEGVTGTNSGFMEMC